ncbi:hypothetical protein R5W23_004863 [Gemmata sp. JC673]|uniref:Membrane protein 6-pyruvoyl-tetrahydropterin synthase-related domain-containing protein n=1 Tax=Gemmata algarum TaxID=2975278 RepID=A0ABU5F6Z3_9BACT|nr:hypothetical protein [Gemmata algarum]MDY3563361.1 hypothetical protein [Gemmata algarum]
MRLVRPRLCELLGLVALAAALVAVAPFAAARSGDALPALAEVMAQTERGVFPVYVGQSEALPDGTPVAHAPAYNTAAALLHLATLKRLTPAAVRALIDAACAAGGLFAMYFGLRAALGARRWARALIAALYVLLAGVVWQAGFGSPTGLAAVPCAPLLLCGFVAGSRAPDSRTAGRTAAALALLWMSDPPAGLAGTVLTVAWLAGLVAYHRRLSVAGAALATVALFAVLAAWHFVSARALGTFDGSVRWADQCALPVAAACVAAALALQYRLETDPCEVTAEYVRESGEVVPLGRLGRAAAVGALGLSLAVLAATVVLLVPRPPREPTAGEVEGPHTALVSGCDPALDNRLIGPAGGPARATLANLDRVPIQTEGAGKPELVGAEYVPVHDHTARPFQYVRAEPNRNYLVTLSYWAKNYRGALHIRSGGTSRTFPLPDDSGGMQTLRVPVRTGEGPAAVIELYVTGKTTATTEGTGMGCACAGVSVYRPEELPIRVTSLLPYRALTNAPDDGWGLETHRRFVPGYRAFVNGARADVAGSPAGAVLIPLQPGPNTVELVYRGTAAMRCAFGLSAAGWLVLAAAAVRGRFRRAADRAEVAPGPGARAPTRAA